MVISASIKVDLKTKLKANNDTIKQLHKWIINKHDKTTANYQS